MSKEPMDLSQMILGMTQPGVDLVPNKPYAEMKAHPVFEEGMYGMLYNMGRTREDHIHKYGFVVMSEESTNALARVLNGLKCIDVGAGTGWISHMMSERGIDITASEIQTQDNQYGFNSIWKNDHCGSSLDILPGDFDAVVMCWPPMHTSLGFDVLQKMVPGQLMISQGEGLGGCTGCDEFNSELRDSEKWEVLSEETKALNKYHLQFPGLHDRWLVQRKL